MSKESALIQTCLREITVVEIFQALQRMINIGSEYEEQLAAWKESVVALRRCLSKVSRIVVNGKDPSFQEIRCLAHQLVDMVDMLENNLTVVRCSIFKWLHLNVITEYRISRAVKVIDEKMSQLLIDNNSSIIDDDDEQDEEKSGMSSLADLSSLQRARQNDIDDVVVGFEGYVSDLLQLLVGMEGDDKQEDGKGRSLFPVGIVGTGGVGKTTLARFVYNTSPIRKEFDCRIWINALPTHHSRRGDVMVDILQQSLGSRVLLEHHHHHHDDNDDTDHYYQTVLSNTVRSCLKEKRVLLVLDDIEDIRDWESIKDVLPSGSKAILTTRHANLLDKILESAHVLSLSALPQDYSWSLFCRNATVVQQHPESLKDIGEAIVERCGGLPLAIVLMARLLATKEPEPSIWEEILRRMELHVSSTSSLKGFLSLCYEDLPCPLRPCFTYCSLFPKDLQELPAKKLCRLWLAEGFISDLRSSDKTITSADAGRYILDELIQRNLIQVGRVGTNGEVETCRILRPVRSFCNTLFKLAPVACDGPCRLIISWVKNQDQPSAALTGSSMTLRTLQFEGRKTALLSCCYQKNFPHLSRFPELGKFKLLRVLDFNYVPFKELPAKMDRLVNLRYLGLRGTGIMNFSSVKTLPKFLQTLDVRDTKVTELPKCIIHLTRLEHLYLCGSHIDKVIPLPIEMETTKSLLNQRKLAGVKITERLAQALGTLTWLKKFSGGQVKEGISTSLCTSLNKLKFLNSLAVKCDYLEQFNLDTLGNCDKLSKLKLGGELMHFDRVALMKSLTCIHIWDSKLDQDPLSTLQHLPNLVYLSLCNAYRGRLIACDSQGYPKLKKLSIIGFSGLEEWGKVEGAALRSLEELKVGQCPKLYKLPEGLAYLDSLQLIQVLEVPLEQEETQKFNFRRIPKFI